MKKLNNQTGSAHVVIIVILVLAVLGLLGFVFWQNFIDKSASNSSTPSATQSAPSNTTKNNKTLIITEWNVKGSYSSNATYGYKIDQYEKLQLTDPSLSSDCNSLLGYIKRATANEVLGLSTGDTRTAKEIYDGRTKNEGIAKVGDYYYFATSPQSQCETDAATALRNISTAAELSILATLVQQ